MISCTATTEPSAVPLVMAIMRLVSGGIVSRTACGRMTCTSVCRGDMPVEPGGNNGGGKIGRYPHAIDDVEPVARRHLGVEKAEREALQLHSVVARDARHELADARMVRAREDLLRPSLLEDYAAVHEHHPV